MPGSIQHTDAVVIGSALLNALRFGPLKAKAKVKKL